MDINIDIDIEIIWSILGFSILALLTIWKYIVDSRRLLNISNELKFFKKEKEYYNEAMIMLSSNYDIIFSNQAAKNLFSLNSENLVEGISKRVDLKSGLQDSEEFFKAIEKLNITDENEFKLDNSFLVISGQTKKADIYIYKDTHTPYETISCIIEINASTKLVVDQKNIGTKDFLTALPSQFLALSEINKLVIESSQKSESFTLFLSGIDHFNDLQVTLGLGYTNQILKTLAQYFIDNPDENITLYRMDSDKFLFLMKHLDEDDFVRKVARDILTSISNIYQNNSSIHLTSSIGVVQYPKDGSNATKLIDNLYIALDQAQKQDKSTIKFFKSEYQIVHKDEIKMNEEIRRALQNKEFLLYYQPIFDLDGELLIGAEALIRWMHPEHGLISADKFLLVAEETGLIIDIGEYVFDEAIRKAKEFYNTFHQKLQITINLSLKEMQLEQLIPRLDKLFDKYEVDKSVINLDIKESAAMENIDRTLHDFALLNKFGLSISLDNFGAKYSSFQYLAMLPISIIKIDRKLIFNLGSNIKQETTVKAIIDLAHTFGYKVIAEGVETKEEASILKSLNCDYAQGYLYARPLSKEDFRDLLKS